MKHTLKPINSRAWHLSIKTNPTIKKLSVHYGDPHDYKKITNTHYQWNQQSQDLTLYQETLDANYFETILEVPMKRLKYYFELDTNSYFGQKGYFSDNSNLDLYATFYFPYLHAHEVFETNSWVNQQIFCQIFIDRFHNGDPSNDPKDTVAWDHPVLSNKLTYGGDLKGITLKLDELKAQGFTALYLTPIFSSPTNHKYDTIDYFEIDPQFGSKEDLKELVDECHKRDMKIVLDAVFNHSGYLFEPFQDVIKHKEQSKYKDWFHIESFEPFNYEMFSIVPNMPKLNTHNPEVQDYLIKVLKYYLEEFKIDGWRFDVANELDHTFIQRINKELKSEFKEVYLLAEIWHDPQQFVSYNEFDGVMEYEQMHIFNQLLLGNLTIDQAISRLTECDFRIEFNAKNDQFHLIDSHDTARLMTQLNSDEDLALMSLSFLSLLRGTICLFYGTHYLLEGDNDPFCRVPYPLHPTSKQKEVEQQITQLLHFRKEHLNIINTERPQLKRSDNQLIVHFSKFEVLFDLDNKSVGYNHH